jgi:hypothetical protein
VNPGSLTREQRMLGGAAASVLFVISLFMPWFDVGPENFGADDVVASWWLLLVFAIVTAALMAAEGLNVELPAVVRPAALAAYLSSVTFIVTLMYFLEGGIGGIGAGIGRDFGLFLAVIFAAVAAAFATISWRLER